MPPPEPPHGGPGEVEEIEHRPLADANARGLYAAIRNHDAPAVDALANLAQARALAECEAKWQTGEEVYHLKRLITYGDDVAEREVNGIAEEVILGQAQSIWTSLHVAAQCGNADAARTLVGQEGAPDARGNGARTPLHEAARSGAAQLVGPLVQYGADLDARCTGGLTPLHVACRHGHPAVVAALCDAGAHAWDCLGEREAAHELSKDVYGETVLDVCRRYKQRLCAVELRGHHARKLCEAARAEANRVADEDTDALHSPAALERGEELYEQASQALQERLKRFEGAYSFTNSAPAAMVDDSEAELLPDGKTLVRLYDRAAKRFRSSLRPRSAALGASTSGM
jgi:hypothetical protein